jgi:hypothetical protein
MSTNKKYWTWDEIKEKVRRDTDTQGETFVSSEEMLSYANEGIDEYEAIVNTGSGPALDYFLDDATINLEEGEDEYSLPSQIYAHKIRKIMFNETNSIYEILPARSSKFHMKAYADNSNGTDPYRYFIRNKVRPAEVSPMDPEDIIPESPIDPKIVLLPASRHTGPFVTIWYLRNLNRLSGLGTEYSDIPVQINFLFQYMKVRVYEKEIHPNLNMAISAYEQQKRILQDILTDAQPDGNNEIEMDLSHYNDFN